MYIKPRDGYTSSQLLKEIVTQIKSKTASSVITWSYFESDKKTDGERNPNKFSYLCIVNIKVRHMDFDKEINLDELAKNINMRRELEA